MEKQDNFLRIAQVALKPRLRCINVSITRKCHIKQNGVGTALVRQGIEGCAIYSPPVAIVVNH